MTCGASGYVERWNFLLGLVFVVILMPDGLVPGTQRLCRKLFDRTSPQPTGGR